jgi:Kef-type K+ transport system membrane component KefB
VPDSDLTSILFVLLLLVGLAQDVRYLFVKLRQPKVVGEITGGILLGPEFDRAVRCKHNEETPFATYGLLLGYKGARYAVEEDVSCWTVELTRVSSCVLS